MDIIEKILNLIIENFDFSYMITINVLTYIIIKLVDYFNKQKKVKTIIKRLILIISIIIVTVSYILTDYQNYTILVNSAIFAPVFYSWVVKPILVKFNIGYKKYDDTLN